MGKCLTLRFLLHRGAFHTALTNHGRAFLSTGGHRGTRGQSFKYAGRIQIAVALKSTVIAMEGPLR
jgi:hypothetical protein